MVRYRASGLDFGGNVRIRGNLAVTDITDPDGNVILSNDGDGHIDELGRIDDDIQLGTDRELQDASGGALIAGDNSGNIDQLGRVDATVTSPPESHSVYASGCELLSPAQSGSYQEQYGSWLSDANDTLYMYLSSMFARLSLKGIVVIEEIEVYAWTGNNNSYITALTLIRNDMTTVGVTTVISDTDDIGNGTTQYVQGTLECDHALVADNHYQLKIDVNHDTLGVTVYGIRVQYHLA